MSLKLRTLLTGVQAVFFSLLSMVAHGQPTIQTDKLDYKPGDTVIITGTGWEAGEIVSLQLDEIPDLAYCEAHNLAAVANANGELYSKQFLIWKGHEGVIFHLTATGQTSGLTTTYSFTDAAKTWVGAGTTAPVTGANNNFNDPVNWAPYGIPGPDDDVSINITKPVNITLSADVVIKSLAFNVIANSMSGDLDVVNSKLTILNSSAIAVTTGFNNKIRFGVIDPAGTGVIDFGGNVTISSTSNYKAELYGTNLSKIIFRGNLTFGKGSGISINRPGTFEFDGVGEQIITWNTILTDAVFKNLIIGNTHSPTVKMAGVNDKAYYINGNLTLNNASVFDLGLYSCNLLPSYNATLTLRGSSTLKLGATSRGQTGSNFPLNFSGYSFSPESWIEYNAIGQTIYNVPRYANLRLRNGLKSTTGDINVNGILEIDGDAVLSPGATRVVAGDGKLDGTGTVLVTRTYLTPEFNSQYTIANKDLSLLTVEYKGGGAQQISPLKYGNLTITASGTRTITFPGTDTVGVSGKLSLDATSTSYSVTGSTIELNGEDQVIPAFNYDNLVLSGMGTKTLQGITSVNGELAVNKDAVLTLNNQQLNVYSNWLNEGTVDPGAGVSGVNFKGNTVLSGSPIILNNAFVDGTLSLFTNLTVTNDFNLSTGGKFSPNSSQVNFQGDLFLYGVWNTTGEGSTASFEGSKPQVIHGIGGIAAFHNFQMNNSFGVRLNNTNLNINGVLSLNSGVISTEANTLMVTSTGSISDGSPASFIEGKLSQVFHTPGARPFPVGRGGEFDPLVFNYTILDAPSNVVVEQLQTGFPGTLPQGTSLPSSRYWSVSQSGASSYQYTISFNKPEAAPSGGIVVLKHEAGLTNSYPVGAPNCTVTGLTSLGDFALAEISVVPTATVASNMSATYGDMAIALLATVSPETATGDVEFFIDGNFMGRATLSAGIAKLSFELTEIPAGKHTIKALYLGDGTYDMSSSDPGSNGELIINALPVEVTAKGQSKVYGNVDPVLNYEIKGRLVGNDQFTGELVRAPGQDVGEYAIGQGTLSLSKNYDLIFVGANFIIMPRAIEVTADTKSKVYGESDPALTYSITGGPLAFQDAFTGTLIRNEGETVGQYEVSQGSLVLNSNYNISFINAPFTINKRSITVTATPKSKLYGEGDPVLTYTYISGSLVSGDALQGTLSRAEGEDVGSYLIDQGTLTAGDNYELTFIKSSLTIAPVPATIEINDLSKVYNGVAQGVTVRTSPENLAVAVTYNGDVTIPINAGSYTVEAVLANSNYKLVDGQGADLLKQAGTLVINPKTLTIAVNNKSRVYGTDNPILDGIVTGLVSSDGISVSYSTTALTTSNVGEYAITATIADPKSKLGNYFHNNTEGKLVITPAPATINLSNLTATYDGMPKFVTAISDPAAAGTRVKYFQGGSEVAAPITAGSYVVLAVLTNNNYTAEPESNTLVINKAPTKTTVSVSSIIYDGKPHGGTASVTGDGGLSQALIVTYAGKTRAGVLYESIDAPMQAGDYTAAASYAESDNYLKSSDSQPFTITQAPATISVIGLDKVYNGTAQGATAVTSPEGLSVNVTYNNSSSVPTDAGSYAVVAVLDNSNYTAVDGFGTLVIAPKTLTVTAADKTKVYGDPLPALDGTVSGDVAVDGITVSYSTTATQSSDVVIGGYPITAILVDPKNRLTNYSVTNTPGVLTITPAPAVINVIGLSKTYNGQPQAATIATLPGGLAVNVTYGGATNTPINAGSYAVVAALNNPNYSATNGTGTLVIDKADQEIVWANPDPITYGTPLKSIQLNARIIGIEGGSATGALTYSPGAGVILDAGNQVLNVTADATDNYKAAAATVTLVVNKAGQVIDFAPLVGKTYGDPPFDVSAVASSGRAVSFSIVSGPATIRGNTITIVGAGDVVVRASQPGDGNYYPAADVFRSFTVQKAAAVITLGGLNHTYDGSVKTVAVTLLPEDLSGISITYQQGGVPVEAPVNAGNYQVTATLNHMNYQAAPVSRELVITKAPSTTTVMINDGPFTYMGFPIRPAIVRVTGAGGLDLTPDPVYANNVNAGTATASYSYEGDVNHEPSEASENFSIGRADATIHVAGYEGLYDGEAHQASGTATGVMGEDLSYLLNFGAGVANVPGGDVSWSFRGNENYKATSGTRAIVLSKAAPEVAAKGGGFMYDGTPQPGSGTVKGVKGEYLEPGVSISYAGTLTNGTPYSGPGAPTEAGVYTVIASFAGNNNYNNGTATAPLRIYAIPVVSLISPQPVQINTPAVITVDFQGEVFNAKWNYSLGVAGTSEELLNKEPDGEKERLTAGQLKVTSPAVGVYTITLSYENGLDARFTTIIPAYAVFYDPSAGFVTGGGWINSPAGAYSPDRTLTGKATFGFVSKYEKGRTVPSGNTEFQFHTAKMNFRSTAYEYLIVTGSRAQYKGTGTINGTGNYGFMLTGVDGEKDGVGKPDLFRIKIWDKNAGDIIVYDNELGIADDAAITTKLGGGSIVIHIPPAGGKKTNIVSAEARTAEVIEPAKQELSLKVFPNPTVSSFSVQVKGDVTEEKISVRVVDLNGRTIEVIQDASSGQTYNIGSTYRPGVYLLEMIQGSRRSQAMLLKVAE